MSLTIAEVENIVSVLTEAREYGLAVKNNMDWCMHNIELEYSEDGAVQADYRKKLGETFKGVKEFLENCPLPTEFPDSSTLPVSMGVFSKSKARRMNKRQQKKKQFECPLRAQYVSVLDDLSVLLNYISEAQFLLQRQTSFIVDKIKGLPVDERIVEED